MRTTRSPSMAIPLVATLSLLVPGIAGATTFTVGDGTNGTLGSLREAIVAANDEGFATAPHLIIIDSTLYDRFDSGDTTPAALGCVATDALPSLYVPTTIQSTGSALDTVVPPISGRDRLVLDGLTIAGGPVRVPNPFGTSQRRCDAGAVQMLAGSLEIIDSIIAPGSDDASRTGIVVVDSDVTMTGTSVSGYASGLFVERRLHGSDHFVTLEDVTLTGGPGDGIGVDINDYNGGSFTNVAIDSYNDGGMFLGGGAWVMTGGSLTSNDSGIGLFDGGLDIDGTLFDDNFNQAIFAVSGGQPGLQVTVRNATFSQNAGELGGAIHYENDGVNGSLIIEDTSFSDNFAFVGGSIWARGRIELDGVTATGSADGDAARGGFLYLEGEGSIANSDLSMFDAQEGGIITHVGATAMGELQFPMDQYLTISNTQLSDASAGIGGALHIYGGATTVLTDVTADGLLALTSGGFAHLNVPDGPIGIPMDTLEATTTMVGYAGSGGLRMHRVSITDALAGNGGAIAGSGQYNEVFADDLTLTGVEAIGILLARRGLVFPNPGLTGSGGAFWMNDGSTVTLSNLTVDEALAESFGGLIYSGPTGEGFRGVETLGDIFSDCRPTLASELNRFEPRFGNTWRIDGLEVTDVSAGFDGGIAFFSASDDVVLHGADFVQVRTGSDLRRGLPSFDFETAHIVTENAASYDMSCVSVCDAASGSTQDRAAVGGTVRHYDAPEYMQGPARSPVVTHRNNVYSYNEASDAIVSFDVCAPFEDTGIGPIPQGRFDTANLPDDTDVFDSGDYGTIDPRARGGFSLTFNTFVGSPNATLVGGSAEDVPVRLAHNLFAEGDVAIALSNTNYLFGSYNQFGDLGLNAQDDAAQVFPSATAVRGAPTFTNDVPECADQKLWLADGSTGQDAGDPDILDWWNDSVADIGAFGGPDACFPDEDQDGFIVVLDCDDLDLEVRPGANETPYDGIDQDCDGEDLCDVDADGFLSDADACGGDDCDDARADVNPGIAEIWYDGIDQDCSGDDCDQDGDGYAADNVECGGVDCDDTDPTIHPGAVETDGDGVDSDCDEQDNIPPGCDEDGDGVLSDSVECGGIDCDDTDATIYPGAPEVAGDGIDSNCDDDDNPVGGDDRCDDDGDGVVSEACGGIDCDDTDASIFPGAEDMPYDGIDQDCDGVDNCDADGDGFNAMEGDCLGDDCDDTDPTINPDAYDIPLDGIDQDCDAEDAQFWVQGGPGGCDCSTTGGSAPVGMMWLGLLGLAALRRRR